MILTVPNLRLSLAVHIAALLPLADALLPLADAPHHDANKSAHGNVRWFWVLGVLATLVGATLTVVGFMLQKHAHRHVKETQAHVHYWAEPRWLGGLIVWVAGQVICWLADGLANRSLLACFNCWNIVVVFAIAPYFLREQVSPRAGVGALVIIGGCVWVILSGPRTYYGQTVSSIGAEWSSQATLWTMLASALLPLAIGVHHSVRRHRETRNALSQKMTPEEYAALSAFFAWYAVLLAKCASTLFTTTMLTKEGQLGHYHFWLFMFLVGLFAIAQMHTLNLGLRSGTTVSVLPIYESFSMTGQVILCGVFFGEFRGLSAMRLLSFCMGVVVVMGGVAILIRGEAESEASAREAEHITSGRASAYALSPDEGDTTDKRV